MTMGRGRGDLNDYWKNATPEQLAERRRKISETIKRQNQEKREKQAELMAKAQALLPALVAEEILMADNKDYIPSQKTINKLKELLAEPGKTIEQIRGSLFRDMTDVGWAKLMKYAFKSHVSQIEDVGMELVRARQSAIQKIKDNIDVLKADLALWKEKNKPKRKSAGATTHMGLVSIIIRLEERLYQMELDFANTLHSIGAVGEQAKSPSFHIHMSIPRPPKLEPKTITVEPDDGHRD